MPEGDCVLTLALLLPDCKLGLSFLICEMEPVIVIQSLTGFCGRYMRELVQSA